MSKLRIVLGLQLLFFVAWGGWLLSSKNTASPEFYLETVPVDPRDLLSGTYVALTYGISTPQAGSCLAVLSSNSKFFVKLEDRGRTAETPDGPAAVYEATDCSKDPANEPGWVSATLQPNFPRPGARYGIERFFLNENDPRKDARSGSVIAKVKIDRRRQLVLLDLVKKI
ncbi:MAG: GDYXXLXY domain-containing protein [Elusimicrobiota bacterium]|nr:GDYXXLXY domain-containing protein [Elusimicrobiota bacterium]